MLRQVWNLATLSALVMLAIIPPRYLDAAPNLCMWRQFTGHNCLGCGGTHAIVGLLHGHVVLALRTNALAIAIAFWMASTAAHDLARALCCRLTGRSHETRHPAS